MYFVSIALVLISAIMTSFAGILLKKTKSVHYSIVNTIYGIILTIVSVPAWIIYRYILNDPIDYGFTKN